VTRKVLFSETAAEDLDSIYDWVEGRTGPNVAWNYTDRLQHFCSRLGNFAERGRARPELGENLRSTVFERRAIVVYRVHEDKVRIVRVLHHGRDLGKAFKA
jgi:toxin ParE1/3/4